MSLDPRIFQLHELQKPLAEARKEADRVSDLATKALSVWSEAQRRQMDACDAVLRLQLEMYERLGEVEGLSRQVAAIVDTIAAEQLCAPMQA